MSRDNEDVENIMRYLQSPVVAEVVATIVAKRLFDIEGFDALPRELRRNIEEQAVLCYAAGYTHAVSRRA